MQTHTYNIIYIVQPKTRYYNPSSKKIPATGAKQTWSELGFFLSRKNSRVVIETTPKVTPCLFFISNALLYTLYFYSFYVHTVGCTLS